MKVQDFKMKWVMLSKSTADTLSAYLGTSVNPVLYMDQPIACLREISVWGQLIISIISEQNHLLGMNYIFCLQMFIQYFLQAFKSVLGVKMWEWS